VNIPPEREAAITMQDQSVALSLTFLRKLLERLPTRPFAVRFWDGSVWPPTAGAPAAFTLALRHAGAVRRMFWPPSDLALGEAYLHDDFDIDGDVLEFVRFIQRLNAVDRSSAENLALGTILFRLPEVRAGAVGASAASLSGAPHSPERDRQAISYHYDLSNEFFALWLDPRMVYSCAYFTDAANDLETAQRDKLDLICRKLRLRSGERLLDIGCGWGGFILHAARHYGVDATGISLSQRQVELATERIRSAGLTERCRAQLRDYREVNGTFDKVASVGMIEHLGTRMLPEYFRSVARVLRPAGVFLNHGISLRGGNGVVRWDQFAQKYVFPDGELCPISTNLTAAEAEGFEVRDVENLREHYALTLRNWLRRLEARREEVRRTTGEATYRVFRLYLAGAAHGFEAGVYHLHQALLCKPEEGRSGLPLTRTDWYGESSKQ
jgi:cyclopropane-fatty-acyl-phospholipid synthase